jgi:protein-disulfide isomerase
VGAKKNSAAKGTGTSRFYLLLGVVAVAGIAIIGYAIRGDAGGAATEPVVVQGADNPSTLFAKAEGIAVGDPGAPVTLIVFSDYQCPGCAQFATRMKPVLEANEVKAGKLKMVYYDLPLTSIHQHSFLAARAARCAGDQGKYWDYHEQLFGRQAEWSHKRTTPLKELKEYGTLVGLDQAAFDRCLESDRFAETVTANALLAQQLGVNSTPTVIINNRRIRDPFDYQAISALIAEESEN